MPASYLTGLEVSMDSKSWTQPRARSPERNQQPTGPLPSLVIGAIVVGILVFWGTVLWMGLRLLNAVS